MFFVRSWRRPQTRSDACGRAPWLVEVGPTVPVTLLDIAHDPGVTFFTESGFEPNIRPFHSRLTGSGSKILLLSLASDLDERIFRHKSSGDLGFWRNGLPAREHQSNSNFDELEPQPVSATQAISSLGSFVTRMRQAVTGHTTVILVEAFPRVWGEEFRFFRRGSPRSREERLMQSNYLLKRASHELDSYVAHVEIGMVETGALVLKTDYRCDTGAAARQIAREVRRTLVDGAALEEHQELAAEVQRS